MPKVDLFMFQDFGYPAYVESAKLAEQHAFENFWLIDSTDAYSDYCAWASLVAVNTSQLRIGPGVTNPLTRHPRVTANHILTIHELSKGRAILGLGAGDNAVRSMGWKPATASVMREAMEVFRRKFKEKKADIPIYVAVGGPMNTEMAFQKADGIIGVGGGGISSGPEGLLNGLERLKLVARKAGRNFSSIPIRVSVAFAMSYNKKEALEEIKGPLARMMHGIFVQRRSTFPPNYSVSRQRPKRWERLTTISTT